MLVKTKLEILKEFYNKTLSFVLYSEVLIDYYKKEDSKKIIETKTVMVLGRPTPKEITAEMLIEKEEKKLKDNQKLLAIIEKRIKKEEPVNNSKSTGSLA